MDSRSTGTSNDLIQTLWNAIDTNMWHGMSCRCCGGGMFTMNAQILEADLLDYLAEKYQSDEFQPLRAAVSARANNLTQSLPAWVRTLEEQNTLPSSLMLQLKSDVVEVLKGFQERKKY